MSQSSSSSSSRSSGSSSSSSSESDAAPDYCKLLCELNDEHADWEDNTAHLVRLLRRVNCAIARCDACGWADHADEFEQHACDDCGEGIRVCGNCANPFHLYRQGLYCCRTCIEKHSKQQKTEEKKRRARTTLPHANGKKQKHTR